MAVESYFFFAVVAFGFLLDLPIAIVSELSLLSKSQV